MASFTDSISQFNPYVQQLPVELMMTVGMQKQAQYDAGVQKVQNYIDRIAGMEVLRPQDKEYLQSKLNELGGNLKTFASADFSNQQLVNSVTGMTSQIAKDEKIQNAVASTAWYKKQKAELDKQYQEGKSSIANVTDFNKQAQSWLDNKEVGAKFNGTYSPYVDLDKKFRDIIKDIKSTANAKDFVYTDYINPDGTINSQGIAEYMTRVEQEGVSKFTIEKAITASLSPDDLNQLRINAEYQLGGIQDSDQMKALITKSYSDRLTMLDSMEKQLKSDINAYASDPNRLKLAQQSLADLQENKTKLKSNLNSELELADASLTQAKTNYYKNTYIDQLSDAFSWEKKQMQIMNSPLADYEFKKQEAALKERKQRLDEEKKSLDEGAKAGGFKVELPAQVSGKLLDTKSAYKEKAIGLAESNLNTIKDISKKMNVSVTQLENMISDFVYNQDTVPVQFRGAVDQILNNRRDIKLYNQISSLSDEDFNKNVELFQPSQVVLEMDEKNKKIFADKVSAIINRFNSELASGQEIKGGTIDFNDDDIDNARALLADKPETLSFSKLYHAGQNFIVLQRGEVAITIPVTDKEMRQFPETSVDPNQFDRTIDQIERFNNGQTNPTGNIEDSYFTRKDMKLDKLNAVADLVQDYSDRNAQYIKLTVIGDDRKPYTITIPNQGTASSAKQFIKDLTDARVKELITKYAPSYLESLNI